MAIPQNQNNGNNSYGNSNHQKHWMYGILLPYPAKTIMKAIYEVLNQTNTVLIKYSLL